MTLAKLSVQPEWSAHQAEWLKAYGSYRMHAGNPFNLKPHAFLADLAAPQRALYDTRKNSGPLKRMRRQKGLLSCPMCGSPVTGHLDHHLPRSIYPEFSIMQVNLVPACAHCNSGVKGDVVHGTAPERFVHPYFDIWADETLWHIRFMPPLEAATFRAVPVAGMPNERAAIVRFHLAHVLGDQFDRFAENQWSTYPREILIRVTEPTLAKVVDQVELDRLVAVASKGGNSWSAAFFRGLASDQVALAFVLKAALEAVSPL